MGKYFDVEKDKQFPCWCQACLVGKTEEQMSEKDIRYCVGCQQVIEASYALEAETSGRGNRYKPRKQTEKVAPMEMDTTKEKTKMSTLNSTNAKVDILGARGRAKTYKKRELPEELIKQLSGEGMGSKAIVSKLKEQGIDVSYKTIQRVLSGERKEGDSAKGDL